MKEIKENILRLLKAYPAEKRKIELLRFEQQNLRKITPEEVLETMAFAKGDEGVRPSKGHISDKTYHIALHYQDQAAAWKQGEMLEIAVQLEQIERRLSRLEHCVEQLPKEQAQVIRGLYFEEKGQKILVEELHLSESTIQRYRERALEGLTAMYQVLQESGVTLDW